MTAKKPLVINQPEVGKLIRELRIWEQREKVRSGFGSQLRPYILNKTWFFSCDGILKQAIYVPGFSTSLWSVAPSVS